MKDNTISTISPKVTSEKRYTRILMLVILILAAITIAALLATRPTANLGFKENSIGQSSNLSSMNEASSQSNKSHLPGHDFGAIYGDYDPMFNTQTKLPLLTYTIAGHLLTRRSELGPLTGSIYDSLPAENSCANQPLITYTIAGVTLARHSDLGILDTSCNSLQAGQNYGAVELASYPVANPCANQPTITYTIAGVTLTRHSDLGILDHTACSALQAMVP
jgi:hypothetical protein